MISLFIAFGVLIVGYLVYGRVAERVFAPDDRKTPAVAVNDGVDCVPMKRWKAFLIQLLNIAGTGPIFGGIDGSGLRAGGVPVDSLRLNTWRCSSRLYVRHDKLPS